jgi:hypothetical protein
VVHPTMGAVYWASSIDDREPRLLTASNGQPLIGWGQWPETMSAFKGGSTTTDDGQTWTGEIWQPIAGNYHADTKLALDDTDPNTTNYNNVYITVTIRNISWLTVGDHTNIVRWQSQGSYSHTGEQGADAVSGSGVGNGQEIIWTATGYPVYIRDYQNVMHAKVGTYLHSIRGNPSYPTGSWYNMPQQNLGPGLVSDNRSIGRDSSGAIYLAFIKPDETKVQLIVNSDGDGGGWTSPVNIHDEGPDGGVVANPSLDIVPSDELRVAYRRENMSGGHEVDYSTSPDGSNGLWTPLEVVYIDTTGTGGLDRSAIDSGGPFGIDVVGITYCVNDTIYYAWKPYRACNWLIVQVNTNPLECLEPDTIFTPNNTVHVTWSQSDNVKHDIWHRRGTWSDQ